MAITISTFTTTRPGFLAAAIFFACSALNHQHAMAQTSGWQARSGVSSNATRPALVEFTDGMYLAAVRSGVTVSRGGTGGTGGIGISQTSLAYSYSSNGKDWTSWVDIAGPVYFHPAIPPVFARDGNSLFLFAVGTDRNLYKTVRFSGAWTAWQQLTWGGPLEVDVAGATAWKRFSVALTRTPTMALEFHILYKDRSGAQMMYNRFSSAGLLTSSESVAGDDGAIATDGANQVWAAVRKSSSRFAMYRTQRTGTSSSAFWPSLILTADRPISDQRTLYDISNVIFFNGSFHVAYTALKLSNPVAYTYTIQHARFRATAIDDGYLRTIVSDIPQGDIPQTELCVYRNKLIAAYNDAGHAVRYARLDTADPQTPWVGNETISNGLAVPVAGRPVLASFNHRSALKSADYDSDNASDDLFAAVSAGNVAGGTATPYVSNFSREIFRLAVDRQFAIYDSFCGSKVDTSCSYIKTTAVSISTENRPFLTEIGYNLWTLPDWLSKTLFQRWAAQLCPTLVSGGRSSWWYSSPCSNAKYPVVVEGQEQPFLDSGSIWIGRMNDYKRIWEELGHETASTIGIADSGYFPTGLTGISTSATLQAYSLFNEKVGSCNQISRCRGFTGIANNYDAQTTQHSFIYVVYYYFSDGDQLRQWIQSDLSVSDDLLKRKYDWIKTNIFRGVEFTTDNKPLTVL